MMITGDLHTEEITAAQLRAGDVATFVKSSRAPMLRAVAVEQSPRWVRVLWAYQREWCQMPVTCTLFRFVSATRDRALS